jgi:hypothetical protein
MRILASPFAAFALLASLAVPATAQLGLSLPAASSVSLGLSGNNASAAGGVAASSLSGHSITAQNSPGGTVAYYYLLGAESSGVSGSYTSAAAGTSTTGMGNTATYVSSNSLSLSSLTLRFGPTGAASGTWNLGADTLGQNYYLNAGSTVEERIYAANPAAVEAALYFNGTKILVFGYSALNMIIDYGPSTAGNDDTIVAYSAPVGFNVVSGLSGNALGIASALANDFTSGGGLVQLRFDSFQTATRVDAVGTLGITGVFSFSGSIQAVPEPGTYALWAGALTLGCALLWRRQARERSKLS